MKKEFRRAVLKALESTKDQKTEILTEADILHLPGAVQKYLRQAGVSGNR